MPAASAILIEFLGKSGDQRSFISLPRCLYTNPRSISAATIREAIVSDVIRHGEED
jgi:hypothetical protein